MANLIDKLDLINKLDLGNLLSFIIKFIDSSDSLVIYFGVGTHFYDGENVLEWDDKDNQQFPPFLNDLKIKYFNIPILVILIDPAFKNEPYLVNKCKNFLQGSWHKSDKYSNLFLSELGVSVITIPNYVFWGQNSEQKEKLHNIEDLLTNLSGYISQPQINSLLFYHEFTGSNPIMLEKIISTNLNGELDLNKICIDITRGSDTSCYFNLSNPIYYPVISFEDSKLKYHNPNTLTAFEKKNILSKYKKFTTGFYSGSNVSYNGISKFEKNILFDKPNEMILCFQIINQDNLIIHFLIEGIIPLIRQLYLNEEYNQFIIKNGINYLNGLAVKKDLFEYENFSNIYFELIDYLNQIDTLNILKESYPDYQEKLIKLKEIGLKYLYLILKIVLNFVLTKYDFEQQNNLNECLIDNFVNGLESIPDKYEILPMFKNFIQYNFDIYI
jgi:hypothetical protein